MRRTPTFTPADSTNGTRPRQSRSRRQPGSMSRELTAVQCHITGEPPVAGYPGLPARNSGPATGSDPGSHAWQLITCCPSWTCSNPSRSTSSARSPPSSSGPRCCSPAARTPSSCSHLAAKAFCPAHIPFPVVHIDTGHNFPEVIEFRDRRAAELGVRLVVGVGAGVDRRGPRGRGDRPPGEPQPAADRHPARRDRGAPFRRGLRRRPPRRGEGAGEGAGLLASVTSSASGTRRISAPSCGTSTTARHQRGEHFRVFPLSNWTELDIWQYIEREESSSRPSTSRTSGRSSNATG